VSRQYWLAATSVLAASMLLTGCSANGGGAGGGATTDTINMALNTDPATFDPALAKAGDDYTTARLLFDTVVRKDADNKLVGGIASSWTAKDAAHYQLAIRRDAACSDGTPITPTVVANSLKRFSAKETGSSGRTLALGGATATYTPDDQSGTVDITLSANWSDFLTGLTLPQAGIVCPAGLADPKALAAGSAHGAFSGPYTLTSSQPAVSYNLTLRPEYTAWPSFAKPLDGTPAKNVILTPITDYSTIATQLLSGSVDIGTLADQNVDRFKDNPGFSTSSASSVTTYLVFNERPGATFANRPELRKAVAQAIDPEAFSDITTDHRGETILSVGSSQIACVNKDKSLLTPPDQAAAKQTLTGVKVRVVGTTLLGSGNEYVAEALRKAGADVTVDSLDNANWATVTSAGGTDWDINVQGDNNVMGTLTSSLLRVMGPATENGGRNKMGLVNDEGYVHVNKAMGQTDSGAQCDALQAAQASLLGRVDAVPLSTLPSITVAREGVSIRTFGDFLDAATMRISE
jgi:peptide/nickel transport system substrate-binding protein